MTTHKDSSNQDKDTGTIDNEKTQKRVGKKERKPDDDSADEGEGDKKKGKEKPAKDIDNLINVADAAIIKYERMISRWEKMSYENLIVLFAGLLTGAAAGLAAYFLASIAIAGAIGIGFLVGAIGGLAAYIWFRRKKYPLEQAKVKLDNIVSQQKQNQKAILEQLLHIKKLVSMDGVPESLLKTERGKLDPLINESQRLSSAYESVSMEIAGLLGAKVSDLEKVKDSVETNLTSQQREAAQEIAKLSPTDSTVLDDDKDDEEKRRLAERKKAADAAKALTDQKII